MLRKSGTVLTLATCAIAASAVFLVNRAAALDADPGVMTADNASGQLRTSLHEARSISTTRSFRTSARTAGAA